LDFEKKISREKEEAGMIIASIKLSHYFNKMKEHD
jgi:hypothetical protein